MQMRKASLPVGPTEHMAVVRVHGQSDFTPKSDLRNLHQKRKSVLAGIIHCSARRGSERKHSLRFVGIKTDADEMLLRYA